MLDSLTVSSTNYAGAAWDIGGGAPDPVVDIRVASDTATPTRVNGPDDVFSITYVSSNAATNIRASDLQAELRFDALDEDVTDYEFIGACRFTVGDATFTGSQQTVACPVDASTMNSGFTLRFHLEQF